MAVPRALQVPYVVQPRIPGTVVIRLPEPGKPHEYFESVLTRREAVRLLSDLAVAIDAAEDADRQSLTVWHFKGKRGPSQP